METQYSVHMSVWEYYATVIKLWIFILGFSLFYFYILPIKEVTKNYNSSHWNAAFYINLSFIELMKYFWQEIKQIYLW